AAFLTNGAQQFCKVYLLICREIQLFEHQDATLAQQPAEFARSFGLDQIVRFALDSGPDQRRKVRILNGHDFPGAQSASWRPRRRLSVPGGSFAGQLAACQIEGYQSWRPASSSSTI